jgi:hypothetical protein
MTDAITGDSLIALLDRDADRLTDRVLAEMYTNPFWFERFGERATVHGRKDGRFHIDYLIQALGSDDPQIMVNYARWLQQVLTSRGMCTRHLAENFDRLAAAIADAGWPDGARAVAMLEAATAGLRYARGAARELQERTSELIVTTVDALYDRHPEWLARSGEAGRTRCADDVHYHLSYAADAIANDAPTRFVEYVTWISGFLARRNVPREHLVEALEVLAAAPRATPELRSLLHDGLAALRS